MTMMKTIKYTIRFFSQWHCGSGTSAGADVDELVVKDKNGMPYIPGKTLKGLIREAVEDYVAFSSRGDELGSLVAETFGKELGSVPEQAVPISAMSSWTGQNTRQLWATVPSDICMTRSSLPPLMMTA